MQSKKESKESSVKIILRFVVTKFVKTCDELVIGHQELHISSKRKANLQKMLKFRQIVEILKKNTIGPNFKNPPKIDFKICEISETYLAEYNWRQKLWDKKEFPKIAIKFAIRFAIT